MHQAPCVRVNIQLSLIQLLKSTLAPYLNSRVRRRSIGTKNPYKKWDTNVPGIVLPVTGFLSKLRESGVAIRRAIQRSNNDAINHRAAGNVVNDIGTSAQPAAEAMRRAWDSDGTHAVATRRAIALNDHVSSPTAKKIKRVRNKRQTLLFLQPTNRRCCYIVNWIHDAMVADSCSYWCRGNR